MPETAPFPTAALAASLMMAGTGPVLAADLTTVAHDCDRGAIVWASYVNDSTSVAVLAFEGRQVALEIAVSASGARYLSVDGQWQWWTKGDSASLTHLANGAETPIYQDCRVRPAP